MASQTADMLIKSGAVLPFQLGLEPLGLPGPIARETSMMPRAGIAVIRKRWIVFLHDVLWVGLAIYGAYWLRFNLDVVPQQFRAMQLNLVGVALIVHSVLYWAFGCYRGVWRFASIPDFIRLAAAIGTGALVTTLIIFVSTRLVLIPRSVILLYPILLLIGTAGARAAYRALMDHGLKIDFKSRSRALIIGAGRAGEMLVRDLIRNGPHTPVAIVDDDPAKQGQELHGVRVRGNLDQIPKLVESYEINKVLIAMPSASRELMSRIVDLCNQAEVDFRTLPSLLEPDGDNVLGEKLRQVTVDDLLGREQVLLDNFAIDNILHDRVVLVTGGGGSIGSELCRQIANHQPRLLVIADNSEFNLYKIEAELSSRFPKLQFNAVLADVSYSACVENILSKFSPSVIFHAAAYKHVPIIEKHPLQGIRNNVMATKLLADTADKHGVERFVLISTDKVVNPASVMGATKRIAELYCQSLAGHSNTHFITTRFGNVLGSCGSVVPLFEEQIRNGGPLTVTHPDITRYFMSMTEAAGLILQACVLGKGGEIYVLDMGRPMKIVELAEKMIRLSGKRPGIDVNVVFTGLRPGEKLHEELFYEQEDLIATAHPKLLLANSVTNDREWLIQHLKELTDAVAREDEKAALAAIQTLVPGFKRFVRPNSSEDASRQPNLRVVK